MKKLILLSTILLGAVTASQAGVRFNFGIGVPLPPTVVVEPSAPDYCPPQNYCPPETYYPPAQTYCPPVYDSPSVVIQPPTIDFDWHRYHRPEWRRFHEEHEEHEHEWHHHWR